MLLNQLLITHAPCISSDLLIPHKGRLTGVKFGQEIQQQQQHLLSVNLHYWLLASILHNINIS